MSADLPAQPLDLDAVLALIEEYGDARESTGAAWDRCSDAEIAKSAAQAAELFDAIRAEAERLRELRDAAIAWRVQFSKPADTKLPRMAALIAAVDKHTEGSGR